MPCSIANCEVCKELPRVTSINSLKSCLGGYSSFNSVRSLWISVAIATFCSVDLALVMVRTWVGMEVLSSPGLSCSAELGNQHLGLSESYRKKNSSWSWLIIIFPIGHVIFGYLVSPCIPYFGTNPHEYNESTESLWTSTLWWWNRAFCQKHWWYIASYHVLGNS
jgi:hypothetical protein